MSLARVSIGMMVYNEERHLARTLESVVSQSFKDYAVVVGDNASTDGTPSIVEQYSRRDERIVHVRHERNMGAIRNLNWLVSQAEAEFFVLASGHDLWSDNYLEALVSALEKNEDAVLAYAPTVWLDGEGRTVDERMGYIDTSDKNMVERFNLAIWSDQHALYGMCRMSGLRKTRLSLEIVGSWAVLLSELAIQGKFVVASQARWYRRIVRETQTREQKLKRYDYTLFANNGLHILPHWRIPFAYLGAAWRADANALRKLKLLASVWSAFVKYAGDLLLDICYMGSRIVSIASIKRRQNHSFGNERSQ